MRPRFWRSRSLANRHELEAEARRPQAVIEGELSGEPKSFVRASLRNADLQRADLRYADLRECDLRAADLEHADFTRADLSWADLRNATLVGADFGTARLVETSLASADLRGANLSRVTGLTWASVRDAAYDRATVWPDGFDPARPSVAGPIIHWS